MGRVSVDRGLPRRRLKDRGLAVSWKGLWFPEAGEAGAVDGTRDLHLNGRPKVSFWGVWNFPYAFVVLDTHSIFGF